MSLREALFLSRKSVRLFTLFASVPCLLVVIVSFWPDIGQTILSRKYLFHSFYYLGTPSLVWSHAVADTLIALAYLAILITLAYLIYRIRRDVPFHSVFLTFGLLIVASAGTHFMEVVTIWVPLYVVAAEVKIFAAIVAVATAIVLPAIIPRVERIIHEGKVAESKHLTIEETFPPQGDPRITKLDRGRNARTVNLGNASVAAQAEIEERNKMEEQLVQTARIVEYSNDAIISCDLDGTIGSWNKAAERIFGYEASAMIGGQLSMLLPDEREEDLEIIYANILQGTHVQHHETRWITHNAVPVDVSLTVSPLRSLLGGVVGFSLIIRDITEYKRAEKALRESNTRLRNILDNLLSFVGLLSLDGVLLEVNRAPLEMAGLRKEDVVGKYVPDTHWYADSEDAKKRVREAIRRAASGETVQYDETIRASEGKHIAIQVTYNPLRDEEGKIVQIVGSAIDITERLNTKHALLESERQYRLLFESSPLPMWVYDHDSLAFLAVNEAAVKHYGFSRDEFLAMTILDIRPHEDAKALMERIQKRKTGLQNAEIWRHRKRDGSIIQVEVTSHDLDFRGRAAQLVVANDITERFLSEEELKRSEARFSQAFMSSPLAITIATLEEGRYVDVNEAFLQLMEHSREEVVGHSVHDLNFWVDPPARVTLVKELLAVGHVREYEARLKAKSGKVKIVNISAESIQLGNDQCVLAMMHDVTEAKRLEEQFRQAQKMEAVGRLAGGVAHDFNNLLSVIIGYSDLSLETLTTDKETRKHNEQIRKAALRASELTRQLLAFSRQQVLQPKVINLNAVIENCSNMLTRIVGEDVSVEFVPERKLGNVKLDAGQLEQVLMNLVVNARDAMPRGGKIIIETMNAELDESYVNAHMPIQPGAYVMLSVTDNGAGIEKELLTRIFDPFFTTKPLGQGTGLGLSMVYGVVQQSGGNIWVYSEVGKGTTFKMYFPRVSESAEATPRVDAIQKPLMGSETILLVEDEEDLRELTAKILRGSGYTVFEASDGQKALQLAGNYRQDMHLLLTDVIMPGTSGSELAANLKVYRPEMKVVYMSGYTGNLIASHGVIDTDSTLLEKPFSKQVLLEHVRAALDARR